MKKILKVVACLAMALIVPFSLVACDKEQVEEATKTAIESGATIIPVEYKQETAEGILKNSFKKLLSSNKSYIKGCVYEIDNNNYSETVYQQTTLIKDGKRYLCYDFGEGKVVLGTYDNKSMLVDVENKTYVDITPVEPDPDQEPGGEIAENATVAMIKKLDLISNMVALSEKVVAGRYFNGATYINAEVEDTDEKLIVSYEFKIVDGYVVSVESIIIDSESNISLGFSTITIVYDDAVNVSMIPMKLTGFTNALSPA